LVTGFAPSIFTNANALDLDISDFECIAPVGNKEPIFAVRIIVELELVL
jgi:hypothetical protein